MLGMDMFVARFYDRDEELLIEWAPFSSASKNEAYGTAMAAVLKARPGTTLHGVAFVAVAPAPTTPEVVRPLVV